MSEGRSQKSARNITAALINKGITYLVRFVLRTIFVYTLTKEYLGLTSLFSSILTLLALADLGFSIALPYSLYKPLADHDEDRINAIMNYYSTVYLCVGGAVLVIGIGLIPFLPYIIDIPSVAVDHIYLIYILFVAQSAASYLFYYKRTLIIADQRNYTVNTIECIGIIIACIIQSIVLLITKNFIAYLLVSLLSTIIINIVISFTCQHLYPYLNRYSKNTITKTERKKLTKNISALAIYKGASAVETSITSIVMTKALGLITVGLWSNYSLIITSMNGILQTIFNSVTASIGNLVVDKDQKKIYKVYQALNLINYWGYGVVAICIMVLIQPFVGDIWIKEDYLLSNMTVVFMSASFFVCGSQNMNGNFRNAYGLFWEGRNRPILMIAAQIILSVVLVRPFGIAGIYMGIIISRLLTVGIIDPYIVHKYGLKKHLKQYYVDYYMFLFVTIVNCAITYYLVHWMSGTTLILWLAKAALTFIICNAIYLAIYFKTEAFSYAKAKLNDVIRSIKVVAM